ncbi:MAG: ATP-binding cassette domain-containing protein [Chloroflexota bacterium]|nr:ATP-binding cassette domain-containing protein [Chloroflexota bacterium]
MIEVRGLDVRYPEAHALKGVDLTVAPGSFLLVAGPSGGGKSTLTRALMGLIPQTIPAKVEGNISVAGMDPQRHSVAQLATRVGLVFQNPATQLFNGTVEEEIAFGPRNLGLSPSKIAARVDYGLRAMDCAYLRQRAVRRLSSGEQQRVAIAAVLAMRPTLLILDEPTANLDAAGVYSIVAALVRLRREFGVTLLVIEHRLAPFLTRADRLIWLADGRVVADGSPAETLARVRPPTPARLAPPTPGDEPLASLRGITAGYDGRHVLRDCSLALRRGDFAALVGPNGAGKTTLARVLAGVLRPRRGKVVWRANGRAPRVGLLQQNPLHQLVCDTVEEDVRFGPRNLGTERPAETEAILSQTDLLSLRHRPTRALSVGQQQRAALAATLSLRPALIILDEPTIGQDWEHLTQMMDYLADLNQAGQTVLLITHDERLVERYAERVWQLIDGRIERGKMQEARIPHPAS